MKSTAGVSNTFGKRRRVCTPCTCSSICMTKPTGGKGGAMDETHHQQTDTGTQYRQPTMRRRVPTVPTGKLGAQGDPGGFDATESELLHVLQSLLPLTGENLDQWSWEER